MWNFVKSIFQADTCRHFNGFSKKVRDIQGSFHSNMHVLYAFKNSLHYMVDCQDGAPQLEPSN